MGLQKGRPSYAKDALKYQPLLVAVLLPWSSILWKKAFWKIDLFCVKLIKHTKKTSEQSAAEKGKCMVIWFSVDSWSFCDTIAYKVGQRLSLPHSLWPTLCSFERVLTTQLFRKMVLFYSTYVNYFAIMTLVELFNCNPLMKYYQFLSSGEKEPYVWVLYSAHFRKLEHTHEPSVMIGFTYSEID